MAQSKLRKWLADILLIIIGDLLLAAAIVVFWEPENLVTGGASGIAIIVADYSGRMGYAIPIWLTNLLINIPLFIAGMKTMSREFLIKTAFATLFLSAALYIASFLPTLSGDLLLAALFGGAASGAGLGLALRSLATTGGSDLAAGILHRHVFRHYSIAKIMFVIDSAIIAAGMVAFGPVHAMYAAVAVFVSSKVTDAMLEGLSFAKAAFIISDHSARIADAVMNKVERGATGLKAQGMYTGQDKNVLLCVVSAKELLTLKTIVHEADAQAFVIVADVREVLGEGFSSHEQSFSMQM